MRHVPGAATRRSARGAVIGERRDRQDVAGTDLGGGVDEAVALIDVGAHADDLHVHRHHAGVVERVAARPRWWRRSTSRASNQTPHAGQPASAAMRTNRSGSASSSGVTPAASESSRCAFMASVPRFRRCSVDRAYGRAARGRWVAVRAAAAASTRRCPARVSHRRRTVPARSRSSDVADERVRSKGSS